MKQHDISPPANATRREFQNSVGWLRVLLALGFIGGGMCFFAGGFDFLDQLMNKPPPSVWGIPAIGFQFLEVGLLLVLAVLGIACCTAGLFFLGARSGIIFDRQTHTVTVWWTWLSRRRSTVYDLRSFAGVSVTTKPEAPITFFPSSVKCPCAGPLHLIFLVGPPGPTLPVATVKGTGQCVDEFADQVVSFLSAPLNGLTPDEDNFVGARGLE
jgi:hypothetical protein